MAERAASHGPITVTVCGRTHRGRVRRENQDRLLVADLAGSGVDGASVGPLRFELTDRGAILLVADGMGGRAGGGRASELAVASVRRAMSDGAATDGERASGRRPARANVGVAGADAFVRRLQDALEEANRDIFEEASRNLSYAGMGTTATLAGILDGVAYLAQVGDSRAYLLRGGTTARLTRDQSLLQDLIDSGVLSEREAESAPANKILQALGVRPSVEPVITYHELRRGDVLLLCSDGLSRVARDEEILEATRETSDCLALCDRLVGLANDRGGPDNVTVIVARLDGDGLAASAGAEPLARRPYTLS